MLLGLSVNVLAVSASDISDNQLFLQYPQYLGSQEALSYVNNANDLCQKIINSQNQTGAVIATILDDGLSIGLQNIAAKLKWGRNFQDSITENAAIKFMEAIAGPCAETFINQQSMASRINKPFSLLSSVDSALDKNQATQLITSVLSELGIDNASGKAPGLYDAIQKKLPFTTAVKYGTEGWKGAVATLKLFSFQYSTVTCLMASVDKTTDLYNGLKMVKEDMQDPAKYFVNHYLKDAILGEIGGFVSSQSSKIIGKAIGLSDQMLGVISLGKTVYFTFIYDGYKVDDFAEAVALLSFASTLDSKLSNLRIKFQQGKGTQGDIQTYKTLFYYDTCAYVAALNGAAGLLNVRNHYDWKGDAEVLAVNIGSKWVGGYDWYFTTCKKALANDLNSGKAVGLNNGNTNTGTNTPTNTNTNTNTSTSTGYTAPSLYVLNYVNCHKHIYCPNRVVNLYSNPTDSYRSDYFSKGQNTPSLRYAIMSDGSKMYEINAFSNGVSKTFWIKDANDLNIETYHTYGNVLYEDAHPHRGYHKCDCGQVEYTGDRTSNTSCNQCLASMCYLDVNGYIDTTDTPNIDGFGTFDVYINNQLVADDVSDYYAKWPEGTNYSITDVKETQGHSFWGDVTVNYLNPLSGVINSNPTVVRLYYVTSGIPYGIVNGTDVTVHWPDNVGEKEYTVMLQTENRDAYSQTVVADSTTYTFKSVKPGTYRICIYAIYDGHCNALDSRNTVTVSQVDLMDTQLFNVKVCGGDTLLCLEAKKRTDGLYIVENTDTSPMTYDELKSYFDSYISKHKYKYGCCIWCSKLDPNYRPQEVHFNKAVRYNNGQFKDVSPNTWYAKNVEDCVELGLMKGCSEHAFNPTGNLTIAEAITIAARIHSIYFTGGERFSQTSNWYQVYMDYAYQNGIISKKIYESDVNKYINRLTFAEIFSKALPNEALYAINSVKDGSLPDVTSGSYNKTIYKLYRAGILTGNDSKGTFAPYSYITRAESAAIVSRMAESDNRISFILQK